jgi:transposase
VVIEPEAPWSACGSGERVNIGEEVSERLDVIPAKFRVIVTYRPRYACAACREGLAQAPALAHLIKAGIPTEALLAHIVVANTPMACRFIGKRRPSAGRQRGR